MPRRLGDALSKKRGGQERFDIVLDKLVELACKGEIPAIRIVVNAAVELYRFQISEDLRTKLNELEERLNTSKTGR